MAALEFDVTVIKRQWILWAAVSYASYRSVRALRMPLTAERNQRLREWMLFFLALWPFSMLYEIANEALDWLPMWPELFLFGIVWLLLPVTKGAVFLYSYLAPTILEGQNKVCCATCVPCAHRCVVFVFLRVQTASLCLLLPVVSPRWSSG